MGRKYCQFTAYWGKGLLCAMSRTPYSRDLWFQCIHFFVVVQQNCIDNLYAEFRINVHYINMKTEYIFSQWYLLALWLCKCLGYRTQDFAAKAKYACSLLTLLWMLFSFPGTLLLAQDQMDFLDNNYSDISLSEIRHLLSTSCYLGDKDKCYIEHIV